jgi:nanoRNase/pAp phosphatase (c-di-AMP/oligoRNAs hydrolase)
MIRVAQGEAFWSKLLEDGKTIEKYKQASDVSINESLGYETEFEGMKCWAINRGRISSDRLGDRISKYDALLPYLHDGKQFTVSMYSQKVDVSEIAKKYGGGGHKGASGFQCNALPFRPVLSTPT